MKCYAGNGEGDEMTDEEKWRILQQEAQRKARQDLLDALLKSTGLDEYIADAIANHERQAHEA